MRTMRMLAMFTVAWLLGADASQASERPPVGLLLSGPVVRPVNGQLFSNTLHISLPQGGTLTNLTINQLGWAQGSLPALPPGPLAPGSELDLPFTATPSDTDEPLAFSLEWNGLAVSTSFDLSLDGYERATTARAIVAVPAGAAPVAARPAGWTNPLLRGLDPGVPAALPGEKDRSITVHGSFCYYRLDVGGSMATDPIGAFGMKVEIYDDDPIGAKLLDTTYCDTDGSFSATFTWQEGFWHEEHPDIFVKFTANNDILNIKSGAFALHSYHWQSATEENFSGTDLDLGRVAPADAADYPALHIMANITKTWTWLDERALAPDVQVHVLWPSGTTAYYLAWPFNQICVGVSREWDEETHAHEYGHHWMYKFDVDSRLLPDYCNGYADSGGCGHKTWCQENANDAWDEGVPYFIADQVLRDFGRYGPEAVHTTDVEDVDVCPENGTYHEALITEGFIQALLNDLVDDTPREVDAFLGTAWADEVNALAVGDVLHLLADNNIMNVQSLSDHLRVSLVGPMQLWETLALNGFYNFDGTPPPGAMTISSSSHVVGVESANNVIEIAITQPTDDFSGVHAYEVHVAAGAPQVPSSNSPSVFGEGAVVFTDSGPLAPGSYYVTVRALDRDNNWSSDYSTAGPFVIREPIPADITYGQSLGAGVDGPLVLRSDATAAPGLVQWSATLPGDAGDVYWNLYTENLGEAATGGSFTDRLRLDGSALPGATVTLAGLAGLSVHPTLNKGPHVFPAGLHTVSARFDTSHDIAEEEEGNNQTARKVVFEPPTLATLATGQRPAPPGATAGHDDFADPLALRAPNQDGLRFAVGTSFDAVAVWPLDAAVDYDCRLYGPAVSAAEGFGHPVILAEAVSGRGAGQVDLVFTNANVSLPHATWDVGVLNPDDATAGYAFAHLRSQPVPQNVAHVITFGPADRAALRGLQLAGGELGWKEVTVSVDPAAGAFNVGWFPANTATGGLDDATAQARTDDAGEALLEVQATTTGRQLIVVWRDPADDPVGGPAMVNVTLRVRVSRPDLALEESPAGWIGPVVPRPDATGTPASVPEPPTLPGDMATTWLNARIMNQGLTAAGAFSSRVEVDGVTAASFGMPGCGIGASVAWNGASPVTVRSGRHTLSVVADSDGAVIEAAEANNRFGEQFAWVPPELPDTGIISKPAPAGIFAGWGGVSSVRAPLRLNCDGFHLAPPGGLWYGVAVQPDDTTDVDLRLFELATGARTGFLDPVAISGWGPGAMDFVLVNGGATAARPFHVGIAGIAGSGDYELDRLSSTFLDTEPEGTYGPFELAADELVQLHDMNLLAGVYHIALVDGSITDLMFSLHGGDLPFSTRSRPVTDGESILLPNPARETLDIIIALEGNYCLAVWRRPGAAAKAQAGYTLEFSSPSDVRPVVIPQSAVSLTSVHPSPFNARLGIEFAVREAGRIGLSIYDLQGRRVRTLVDQALPAGSQSLTWDGTDDRGGASPAGIYLLRLTGGGHVEQRKVALVK